MRGNENPLTHDNGLAPLHKLKRDLLVKKSLLPCHIASFKEEQFPALGLASWGRVRPYVVGADSARE